MSAIGDLQRLGGSKAAPARKRDDKAAFVFLPPWFLGASLDQSGSATNASVFGTWWNTQLTSLSAAGGQSLRLLKLPGSGQPAAADHLGNLQVSTAPRVTPERRRCDRSDLRAADPADSG